MTDSDIEALESDVNYLRSALGNTQQRLLAETSKREQAEKESAANLVQNQYYLSRIMELEKQVTSLQGQLNSRR